MLVPSTFWRRHHQMPPTLPPGKRSGQTLAATGVPGPVPSRLFHIMDQACGLRFLVDTGAEVSVLPPSCTERKCPHDSLTLQAVNSTPITTYGTRSLTLISVSAAPFVGYSSSRMSSNPSLVQISSAISISSST